MSETAGWLWRWLKSNMRSLTEVKDSAMSENVVSLTTQADLDRVTTLSNERPVFIYKHSSICPISTRTYRIYHQYADRVDPESDLFFVEVFVIEHRDVSNMVAQRFGVMHQSPQLLLLSKGQAVWNTSHFNITAEAMDQALAER